VSIAGNPTQAETEKITQIWQGSLFNANIETQRYKIATRYMYSTTGCQVNFITSEKHK